MGGRLFFRAVRALAIGSALMALAACKRSPEPIVQPTATPAPTASASAAEASASASEAGDERSLRMAKEIKAPFGRVRIEEFVVAEPSHADSGSLDVSYLDAGPPRKFPKAVENGSFGEMEDWHVNDGFSDLPVVVSEGGGTWQGQTCSWTVLTELRPEGPVELATIETAYDDSGMGDNDATSIEGKIGNIVKNRSFDVRFSGTRKFTAHYMRSGNTYKLEGGDDSKLSGC